MVGDWCCWWVAMVAVANARHALGFDRRDVGYGGVGLRFVRRYGVDDLRFARMIE